MVRPRILRTDRSYFVVLVGLLGAIGILDTAILNPTIAAYAKVLGADVVLASFIAGLYSIVAIPASLVMGLTIDVIGRKRALIVGLGLTALWIYGYSEATIPLHLLIFRVTHSISGSLVFPASIAIIIDTTRRSLGRGIGVYWAVVGSALAIGSSISAVLVQSLGFRSLFLFVVGISIVGMVIAFALPETAPERIMPRVSLRVIASSIRWLSIAYVSIFSLYFAFGAIVGSLSLAIMLNGASPEEAASTVGIYIAIATMTSLPVFYIVGRVIHRVGPVRILALGIATTAVSQLLLTISLRPLYAHSSSVILGFSIASVFVASTAIAALPKARGASIGLHQTANIAGVAVAAPISGLLLKHLGGSAPFAVALAVQMLTLVVIIASRRVTRSAELEFFDTHDEPGNPSPLREKR